MPLAAKCALRWKVHSERLEALKGPLESRLLVLNYEELILRPDSHVNALGEFLGLSSPIPLPHIKAESLGKWRTELDEEAIRQIEDVTGVAAENCAP
jgi:hypothetical protein